MMHARWAGSLVAGLALAILLAGVMPASAVGALDDDDPAAEGKVTAYEAEKSITVQVKDEEKKDFKVDSETKIEGELAVGKEVKVWAKDGKATKIVVK